MAFVCDGCCQEKRLLMSLPLMRLNGRYARPGKVEVDLCYDCSHSVLGYKGQK